MLALLLVLPGAVAGQDLSPGDAKPLVTVSFSGYGELQKDAAYLGQLMNNPQMGQMLDAMITMGTGGQGLVSVDPNRPWGVTVQTDADQFPVLGFVPVSDVGKFVDLLKSVDMKVTDNGDGTYTIDTPANQPLAMRYQNGWAYLADNATRLEQLPADPVKSLGSLPAKYDLAALIHVVNLPQPIRQMISTNLSMGAAMAAQRQPEESDEQFAMRKMATQNAIKQFNRMIEQLDKYLVGLALKRDAGTAMIDVAVSAQPGTELAGQFATMADAKTDFFGFADESAAVWANWARDLTDDEVLQLKAYVAEAQKGAEKGLEEQDLSADDLEKARGMLAELFTVVNENLEAKKTDGLSALKKDEGGGYRPGGAE